MAETETGIKENVAGLLCYLLWWVTGVIFLIIEPKNKFIRFHAIQSIIIFGVLWIAGMIFWWIPFIGLVIGTIIWVVGFILWILMMYKAYQGLKYKLPVTGDMAEKWAG
jgi:uncharacterized membrane protein